ncbi:MAG: hypothetical protein H7330_01465 [Hymenobacteraceae bacterium]|nr:hypothetical protein [Hymenobacteraceae bacterium]
MAHNLASTTLAAAVRVHFGLSQAELGRYLGVSAGQVAHAEAGRRRLPALLTLRLTRLARLLPPPEGTGPPAFVPEVLPTGPPIFAPVVLVSEPLPVPGPLAVGPLRQRQRQCARHLVLLRRDWHALAALATRRDHRRWVLAVLAGGLVPHPADVAAAAPAEQAHQRRWLAELAAAVPAPAARRPEPRTALTLLLLRLAATEAEAAALARLLAGTQRTGAE